MKLTDSSKLAQSSSVLGATILGFGIGSKWGHAISNYAIWIIVIGAFFHVYGMYITQMKDSGSKAQGIAKILWISAWICLIALIGIVSYLLLK